MVFAIMFEDDTLKCCPVDRVIGHLRINKQPNVGLTSEPPTFHPHANREKLRFTVKGTATLSPAVNSGLWLKKRRKKSDHNYESEKGCWMSLSSSLLRCTVRSIIPYTARAPPWILRCALHLRPEWSMRTFLLLNLLCTHELGKINRNLLAVHKNLTIR